jgi:hypothetical protein
MKAKFPGFCGPVSGEASDTGTNFLGLGLINGTRFDQFNLNFGT